MGVSRSGYYAWLKREPSERDKQDLELAIEILQIYTEQRGNAGSPKIYNELRKRGWQVSPKRVARLMREQGLRSKYRRKYRCTTNSRHNLRVFPNLLQRNFSARVPNEKWAADISCVPTREGWLYIAIIIDLYSRRIVGWAMDNHMRTELPVRALNMACRDRSPPRGLIHHSDRGVQYASHNYQQILHQRGIRCSMSRVGDCWDNAVAESFFGILKGELINQNRYGTREEATNAIFEYITVFYDGKRIHSALDYLTPRQYEAAA